MEGLAKYMIIFVAVLSTMYFLLFSRSDVNPHS